MSLLALSCYILIEVPENMKPFGLQARSNIHAKWIRTASAYLRLLICDICHLDDCQKSNFIRLICYLISVYVPSFY